MIPLELACPERFGMQGTAKPDSRTAGGAGEDFVKIMCAIIRRIALTSVRNDRTGRGGGFFFLEPSFFP